MNLKIFRHYDIRGVFDVDFKIEDVSVILKAILNYASNIAISKKIVLGRDARLSSQNIFDEAKKTILSLGFDVVDFGICSTPMIASSYYFDNNSEIALMITASHNFWECNGFKIFYKGENVFAEELVKIKNLIEQDFSLGNDMLPGKILSGFDARQKYFAFLREELGQDLLQNYFVFDSMFGVTGHILEEVFKHEDLNLNIFRNNFYFDLCDKKFISPAPDPTVFENLIHTKNWLIAKNLPFTFVFDGDGDRMTILLQNGRLLLGEEVLAFFLEFSDLPKERPIVVDVACSSLVEQIAQRVGVSIVTSKIGIANIKQTVLASNAFLAGETSTHFLLPMNGFLLDDGIFVAFKILKILHDKKVNLLEWVESLPQVFISPVEKFVCSDRSQILKVISHITEQLSDDLIMSSIDGIKFFVEDLSGWALIRPSNTEDCFSLRFESTSFQKMLEIKDYCLTMIKNILQKE